MSTQTRPLPFSAADAETNAGPLPPLLEFADGSPVRSAGDWRIRRAEIAKPLLEIEYGGMPPSLPVDATSVERISAAEAKVFANVHGAHLREFRLSIRGGAVPLGFSLRVWTPPGDGPFPAVLYGDTCWAYLTTEIIGEALRRGIAVAAFNRCEIARDSPDTREHGIYLAFPGRYGVISAWAWAYHRAFDALSQIAGIDCARIAVTGHSRGGKAAELAAATDERIAMVADNNSGCGGFGCFRVTGPGAERIRDITEHFPFWFADGFNGWEGREAELPFDQHFLGALVAPRPRLVQVALGDPWSNPVGACVNFEAVDEVYRFLGADCSNRIVFRDGGHFHRLEDWVRMLDFFKETAEK